MDAFVPEVAPPPLLECRDLTKRYGATVALDRFTVSLPAGRIVGLLGPNGSGKTTLLKMIAGVAHPTAGDIRVAGYEVGPESKALVSYLPERPYFSRSMRVREMIAYFADFYEDFDAALARDMLARLGVPEDAPTSALSKGTVEKVQLTLVMARHAALYLLDEPIGGVDPAAAVVHHPFHPSRTRCGGVPGRLHPAALWPDAVARARGLRDPGEGHDAGRVLSRGVPMLGKLFAQEMRALWKPAAIMLAVMVVAGVVGIGCIEATDAVSRAAGFASRYVNEASAASNLTVVFVMAALFCGFLVWASLVAVYVFIAMRFYRTMFTDEGYLTLTLPVRAGTLVAAKFWAAFLLAAVFTLMACALASLAMLAITDGDGDMVSVVLSLLGGWSALTGNGGVVSSIMGVANALVSAAYTVGLAFLSLTLGAWWARRHKVAAAVALYVGIGWVISLLFSIVGVLAMVGDTGTASFMLSVVSIMQTVVNLAVAGGGVALSAYLVRAKVDLS